MSTNDNMAVWKKVCKTDPAYTKVKSDRGRSLTSITPQYQLQMATDTFGPYGKGFGFERCDIEEREIMGVWVAVVKAVFFFVDSEGRHTFPVNNTWTMQAGKRGAEYLDIDYAKKAETNTMSKALSKLGFGADVFMGQFDDHDYVEQARNESALAKAENKIEVIAEQEKQHREWVETTIRVLETSVNMHELETLFKKVVRKANLTKDTVSIAKFNTAKDKRKAELEAQ